MTNTGVPFTSMRELGPEYLVPPEPTAPWEASSRVVQAILEEWSGPLPVAWAVFPHHPFAAPDRLSNRTPRAAEVRAGAPVALALLDALRTLRGGGAGTGAAGTGTDVRVVAVGRKAQGALAVAGIDAVAVRHRRRAVRRSSPRRCARCATARPDCARAPTPRLGSADSFGCAGHEGVRAAESRAAATSGGAHLDVLRGERVGDVRGSGAAAYTTSSAGRSSRSSQFCTSYRSSDPSHPGCTSWRTSRSVSTVSSVTSARCDGSRSRSS